MDTNGATAAVQGFGNVGQYAALHAQHMLGCKLVAVSDSAGGVINEEGMDAEALMRHKAETGRVADFPGSLPISNKDLLELPVDILFPAAIENVITKENAPRIRARISCELANGPQTPEADEILHANGVLFIPDLLANAGGVTASYFEMVQNVAFRLWTTERAHQELEQKMTDAFQEVHARAEREGTHMRMAAYMVAVERVAEAVRLRGWI
jgi:glutamate dehydrogenase (NAD(P)+)